MRERIGQADPRELLQLLSLLYQRQTTLEQNYSTTVEHNNEGFNAVDARVLTDIAQRAERYGSLTPRQADLVRRKLKKYARQLAHLRSEA
jgi:hypothetical protein